MSELENYFNSETLKKSKQFLVPYLFTENYYQILKKKLTGEKLSANQRYYYNHFIKKKLLGVIKLMDINTLVNGKSFIIPDRLKEATKLLKKYSRKHKNKKLLVSGSFLYHKKYNDIDIFVISKYDKADYRENDIHVNYLPYNVEETLFFHSLCAISVKNFKESKKIEESIQLADILQLYELVILLIMQKDMYLQELRDLVMKLEYSSSRVVLNSLQLKSLTDKITKSKSPIKLINQYFISKIVNSTTSTKLKSILNKFIKKNSSPEKGHQNYKNWKLYNQVYKEAIDLVA